MRILIVSPIGVTRRVVENWLSPLGHKILGAETYESASRQLSSNSGIQLVITEWLLGGQNAYDVLKKTQQITHVSDAEETTSRIKLIVMTTPGWENTRHTFQLDALKASDQVEFIEKPINRKLILDALAKVFPANDSATKQSATAASVPPQSDSAKEKDLLRQTVMTQQETLQYLAKLHADAQQKLQAYVKCD